MNKIIEATEKLIQSFISHDVAGSGSYDACFVCSKLMYKLDTTEITA